MAEEKSSPMGIIVVVAVIAVVAAYFVGKSGGGNGDQTAGNQQQPTNGSDTNQTAPPPSPQKKANGSDMNKTAPPPEPPKPKYDFAEGLVAYYPFNGNAKDESGNGHDGEVYGTIGSADRHGSTQRALLFRGLAGDRVLLPHNMFNDVSALTLSMWVNLNTYEKPQALFSLANETVYNAFLLMFSTKSHTGGASSSLKLWTEDELAPNLDLGIPCQSLVDRWGHIVVTWDDSGLIAYVDGDLKHEANYKMGALKVGKKGAYIGQDQDALGGRFQDGQAFKGSIDDVRIYNRALSAEEVQALYDLEKPKK